MMLLTLGRADNPPGDVILMPESPERVADRQFTQHAAKMIL